MPTNPARSTPVLPSLCVVVALGVTLLTTASHAAEIKSLTACRQAIAEDPQTAREDAAIWTRLGGGVEARICEAAALEALGATATAARLLTALAENPNRAIAPPSRAVILEDAAKLWLAAGYPEIAGKALDTADSLTAGGAERRLLRVRVSAALGDWTAARDALDTLLGETPDDASLLALRAAAHRRLGALEAAAADAETARNLDPLLPEAQFEAAAAAAELGETDRAAGLWLKLITAFPDSTFAVLARRNLQALTAGPPADPKPSPPHRGPPRPRPPEVAAPSE